MSSCASDSLDNSSFRLPDKFSNHLPVSTSTEPKHPPGCDIPMESTERFLSDLERRDERRAISGTASGEAALEHQPFGINAALSKEAAAAAMHHTCQLPHQQLPLDPKQKHHTSRARRPGIYEDLYTTAMAYATGHNGRPIDLKKAKLLLDRATTVDIASVPRNQRQWVALAHNALGDFYRSGKAAEAGWSEPVIGERQNEHSAEMGVPCVSNTAEANNHKDLETALEHYRFAASYDDPSAIFNMGLCHAEGIGTTVDDSLAIRELHRAAERNCPAAQCYLAVAYAEGSHGVEKNICLAKELLARSLENGYAEASTFLDRIEAERVVKSLKEVAEEKEDDGPVDAKVLYALGRVYETGDVILGEDLGSWLDLEDEGEKMGSKTPRKIACVLQVDPGRAQELYERSARLDHAGAQYRLGSMLLQGHTRIIDTNDPKEDQEAALRWLERAANQGHRGAIRTLEKRRLESSSPMALRSHDLEVLSDEPSMKRQVEETTEDIAKAAEAARASVGSTGEPCEDRRSDTLNLIMSACEEIDQHHLMDVSRVLDNPRAAKDLCESCGRALELLLKFCSASSPSSHVAEGSNENSDKASIKLAAQYAHTTMGRRVTAAKGLALLSALFLVLARECSGRHEQQTQAYQKAFREWTMVWDLAEVACISFPPSIQAWMTATLKDYIETQSMSIPSLDAKFFLATLSTLALPEDLFESFLHDPLVEKNIRPSESFEKALHYIDECLEGCPNNHTYLRTRGQLRTVAGRYREALKDFDHALALQSGREGHGVYYDRGCAALLLQLRLEVEAKRRVAKFPMRDDELGGLKSSFHGPPRSIRRRTSSSSVLTQPKTSTNFENATATIVNPPPSPITVHSAGTLFTSKAKRPPSLFLHTEPIHTSAAPSSPLSPSAQQKPSLAKRALEDFETFSEFASPEDGRQPGALYGMALCHWLLPSAAARRAPSSRADEFKALAEIAEVNRLPFFPPVDGFCIVFKKALAERMLLS
ncbi:hypothetical protein HDU67_007134 [Dinochytrium kinnereticum]|nr:hypothetical protein HDU67_007134 [Dinochytrium kinnereticum]